MILGRNDVLNDFGITVIRFNNDQILEDIDLVINQIDTIVKQLLALQKYIPI
jgi:very-short-patch-repair endonuclease